MHASSAASSNVPDHAPQEASPPAQISAQVPPESTLFLRNLRFLDVDLLPDWPVITSQTFRSSKDAHLKQTGRVHCAEWALYRLFELWDANQTKTRLQPFFPALEPLQSKKLRATLFQMLTELKRCGILDKECMLRKSMLDDCKGEKFEKLVFLFSAAVLRRVVMRRTENSQHLPVVLHLATATKLAPAELELLQPLAIAHEISLRTVLERQQDHDTIFQELGRTFTAKQLTMAHRTEQARKHLREHERSFKAACANVTLTKRQLQHDHTGDQRWLNVILSGDNAQAADDLLEDSFENIWAHMKVGKGLKYDSKPDSLLADLNKRVEEQQSRLELWRSFQNELSHRNEEFIVLKSPEKSPQKLQLRSPIKSPRKTVKDFPLSPKKVQSSKPIVRKAEVLVHPVRKTGAIPSSTRLPSRSPCKREQTPEPYARGRTPFVSTLQDPIYPGSATTNTMAPLNLEAAFRSTAINDTPIFKRSVRESSPAARPVPRSTHPQYQRSRSDNSLPPPRDQQELINHRPSMLIEREVAPEQATSPPQPASQLKSTLADRARLSLSFTNSPRLDIISPMGSPESPSGRPTTVHPSIRPSYIDTKSSLSERTRKSLFASQESADAANRARGQHRKVRSVHMQSSYPVNPFGRTSAVAKYATPQRLTWDQVSGPEARHAILEDGDRAPNVESFVEDLDCASVFKTRSRVRVSPPPGGESNQRHEDGDEDDG